MITIRQHLGDCSLTVVEAIAQRQGLVGPAASKEDWIEALEVAAAQEEHRTWLWHSLSPEARQALLLLAASGNQMPVATFQRHFGEIRRLGDARLQQEQPWMHPANVAEELWYAGYVLRAFQRSPEGLVEMVSIPAELLPLPEQPPHPPGFRFASLPPVTAPQDVWDGSDMLLEDLATLLIYVRDQRVWLGAGGRWREKDRLAVQQQWRHTGAVEDDCYFDLVLHCAQRQGLLERRLRRQQIMYTRLQAWLQQSRFQQARACFVAWRDSLSWLDLCRTPGLHCEKGNWSYDPQAAREAVLSMLAQAQAGQWRALTDFIQAVYEQNPDFLRPDGQYDTWYIRGPGGDYLHGFANWHEVEGRFLRFLWQQPLFYLGLLLRDAAGELWALSDQGYALLHDASPEEAAVPPLQIDEAFYLVLPPRFPLRERFRIARFATWIESSPRFRYRITRRSLRRARGAGIRPARISAYLQRLSQGQVPANVAQALERLERTS